MVLAVNDSGLTGVLQQILKPEKAPVKTMELLTSIMESDTDDNRGISQTEITKNLESKDDLESLANKMLALNLVKLFSQVIPGMGQLSGALDTKMAEYQQELAVVSALTMVNNNFAAFSAQGNAELIEKNDFINILQSATSDDNINDFSDEDLEELAVTA